MFTFLQLEKPTAPVSKIEAWDDVLWRKPRRPDKVRLERARTHPWVGEMVSVLEKNVKYFCWSPSFERTKLGCGISDGL